MYNIYLSSIVKFFTLKIKIKLFERFCKAGENSRMFLNVVNVLFGVGNSDFLNKIKVERFRVQRSGLKNTQPDPIKEGQHLCIIAAFSPNG